MSEMIKCGKCAPQKWWNTPLTHLVFHQPHKEDTKIHPLREGKTWPETLNNTSEVIQLARQSQGLNLSSLMGDHGLPTSESPLFSLNWGRKPAASSSASSPLSLRPVFTPPSLPCSTHWLPPNLQRPAEPSRSRVPFLDLFSPIQEFSGCKQQKLPMTYKQKREFTDKKRAACKTDREVGLGATPWV